MKRRNFVLTSGSAILSGLATSRIDKPVIGLNFQLSTSNINVDPRSVNSILVQFDTLELVPQHLDESKPISVTTQVELEDGSTSEKTDNNINFKNGVKKTLNDTSKDISTLLLTGYKATNSFLSGEVEVIIDHTDISRQSYKKTFTISSSNIPVPDSGLSRWTLDNTDVSESTATDIWGGYNATINGAKTNAEGANKNYTTNEAFLFDGTDYVRVDNITTYNALKSLTLSLWANFDSLGSSSETVVAKSDDRNATDDFGIRYTGSSNLEYFVATDGHDFNEINVDISQINSGEWHHYALTWSKSSAEIKAFIDGERVARKGTLSEVTDTSDSYIEFGIRDVENGSHPFSGKLDDIRIHSKKLTETEVSDLYNTGSI